MQHENCTFPHRNVEPKLANHSVLECTVDKCGILNTVQSRVLMHVTNQEINFFVKRAQNIKNPLISNLNFVQRPKNLRTYSSDLKGISNSFYRYNTYIQNYIGISYKIPIFIYFSGYYPASCSPQCRQPGHKLSSSGTHQRNLMILSFNW